MTLIAKDHVATFNYTLTDSTGETLDKSPEGQPLAYLHGHHNIIPGLEKELEGKSAGDALKVTVAPAEAYGEYLAEAVQEVKKEMFQGVDAIEVGMQFQADTSQGMQVVTVKEVNDDVVIIDANHPLAGKELTFDVEIVEVRAATEDELSHGHAHGVGGHHH